jgi:enamidase
MRLDRKLGQVLVAIVCTLPCIASAFGATDVWVSHVAFEGGWKTGLSAFYTGAEASATLIVTRMDSSGSFLEQTGDITVQNNTWASIPDSLLAYNGSARLRSAGNLLVKVSYRYGESPSVCEFYLTGETRQEWVIPNSAFPWFDWTGIALMNSTGASASVILEALSRGIKVASGSITLARRARYARTSAEIWNGLSSRQFDTVIIRASAPVTAPIFIAGNFSQDRHVFFTAQPRPQNEDAMYLVNGTLIDGTGSEPLEDAVVVIRNGRILAVGKRGDTSIPEGAAALDLKGGFVLPGFINTHVHNAFTRTNLAAWAQAGVTTVRDVGAYDPPSVVFGFRDSVRSDPSCARVIAAGPLVTVPGGYPVAWRSFPALTVTSVEDARLKIAGLLDQGAELIKIVVEDGLGQGIPTAGWPTLNPSEVQAIVETAHGRGVPVTAHITFTRYLQVALDAAVDDCAHSIFDPLPDRVIQRMIDFKMALVPTLTAQGMNGYSVSNLRRFVEAGGKVAMGNDGGYIAGLEIGMPITELEAMQSAGMTPMQIIVAATKNAAEVCRLGAKLGTIQFDKEADILVVRRNPLENLRALLDVEHVIHGGSVIR